LSRDAETLLRRERVDVVNLRRASEAHAVTVALSTVRDRSFVTFGGVNRRLQARLPAALARRRARHVHFAFSPVHCATWTAIVERLRARGTTTSWDFGWDGTLRPRRGFTRLLRAVDFVFVNELEAAMYADADSAADSVPFWRRTARNTIVKLGARGSRWIGPSTDARASAPRVRVVDTTGAGDAFNAGFLTAFLRSAPPVDCLRAGNRAGARSTRAAGGVAV
jgi:sugar/nucleoside kinase (ribokinase family)